MDFTGIPGNYTDLILTMTLQSVSAATTWGYTMRLNGDSGSNYSTTWMYGNGTSAVSTRQSNATALRLGGDLPTSGFSVNTVHLLNYSNSTTFKTFLNPNGTASADANMNVGLWRSTVAITSVQVRGNNDGGLNMAVGSTFTLWGVK